MNKKYSRNPNQKQKKTITKNKIKYLKIEISI